MVDVIDRLSNVVREQAGCKGNGGRELADAQLSVHER
jgi:hypothetical protein